MTTNGVVVQMSGGGGGSKKLLTKVSEKFIWSSFQSLALKLAMSMNLMLFTGKGQFGIITRARIALEQAPQRVHKAELKLRSKGLWEVPSMAKPTYQNQEVLD
ncbi:hypothetical protein HAX54_015520 [Datura stramonium]|uniref:Uncharacterized protein n=1 Tax=Datura stramonium TaxID=4076 RepID=A0ABS8TPT3_DATST|nr:hypothetical protein [Datura stramonium]